MTRKKRFIKADIVTFIAQLPALMAKQMSTDFSSVLHCLDRITLACVRSNS
jgi:hypothetical protein